MPFGFKVDLIFAMVSVALSRCISASMDLCEVVFISFLFKFALLLRFCDDNKICVYSGLSPQELFFLTR